MVEVSILDFETNIPGSILNVVLSEEHPDLKCYKHQLNVVANALKWLKLHVSNT